MKIAKMLYMDRNGVSVNNYTLRIKKESYAVTEIIGYSQSLVNTGKLRGVLSVIIGFALFMFSFSNPISSSAVSDLEFGGRFLSANLLILYLGIAMSFIGLLFIIITSSKYALVIITTRGEKIVVSKKKRQINKLENALNSIFKANGYVNNCDYEKEVIDYSENEYIGTNLASYN